jgi:hypothetical protein
MCEIINLKKRKDVFQLTVSEFPVYNQLVPLLQDCDEAAHHDRVCMEEQLFISQHLGSIKKGRVRAHDSFPGCTSL